MTRTLARRRRATAALGLTALALSAGTALAATAGDLDPGFDGDGRRTLPFMLIPDQVLAQPDGKILLTDSESFTVARLNPDGAPDRGFGGDGTATAEFGKGARITSAALQPDGKLVVAGQTGSFAIAVARFDPDGSLDRTFDPAGPDGDGKRVYTALQPRAADATLVQPDGGIVLAGRSTHGMTASRLTATGAPDGTAFDHAGDIIDRWTVASAALAEDGAIVVAGAVTKTGSEDHDVAVARFTAAGKLDESLGGTGMTRLLDPNRDDRASAVFGRPDGGILIAGTSGPSELRMTVMRLNRDGTPDTAFGDGGIAAPDIDGRDAAVGAGVQPDGKIVIAGGTLPGEDFAVARLDASGALDPTFGDGGRVTIPFEDAAKAYAAALQPDGRPIVAGLAVVDNRTAVRTVVARLLADQPPAQPDPGQQPGTAGGEQPTQPVPPRPRCAGRVATIVGTASADTLRGTRGADVIVALGGDDRVLAAGRGDVVCGGPGRDRLSGGAGRDLLSGGPGRDRLDGDAGRDRCLGGAGRDRSRACERRR